MSRVPLPKGREREQADCDENRRAVGTLNPLRGKNEGKGRGGEGNTHLSVTSARLVQKAVEGKNSHESGRNVEVSVDKTT